jgi:hypothetical protein
MDTLEIELSHRNNSDLWHNIDIKNKKAWH